MRTKSVNAFKELRTMIGTEVHNNYLLFVLIIFLFTLLHYF